MSEYITKLLEQRGRRADIELTWELEDALSEKHSRGESLSPVEALTWQLCIVSTCDGIAEVLESNRDCVHAAATFAQEHGLLKTAEILANAANGIPVAGPVTMSVGLPGDVKKKVELPYSEWGATDLSLSLIDESLDGKIVDFVAEHVTAFNLAPPVAVARRIAIASQVATLAGQKSASELFAELLAHRSPQVRAFLAELDRVDPKTDFIDVPVRHRAAGPAKQKELDRLAASYGPAAAPLLQIYGMHNGAELFVADGEPGFVLCPIKQWPQRMDRVMEWAREVTWQDEPEDIPDYLESSIPFGHTPGDSEHWILVTTGPHAGKIMLSDTDVIDDDPRFESIGEFFAALIINTRRVIGCGGHTKYRAKEGEGPYYPEEYLYQSGEAEPPPRPNLLSALRGMLGKRN